MITDDEKKIIEDGIKLSRQQANCGVKFFVMADGSVMTNYVPFKTHKWTWTQEHSDFAIDKYTQQ